MLELTSVRVDFGSRTVIDDLTWSVGRGDTLITALLGPSGCGKSTLLRAVAGLEPIAAGVVAYDGEDLSGVPPHRRDFGVVFQDGQLFSGRTVAQNVAYGLKLRRWSRERISARVDQMLELVQLTGMGGRKVTELSGGQAQRVALARSLAPQPRLLLLDEPLAALDRRLRDELAIAIGDIVRATATPTVLVTHDHTEAALIADEVSVMRAGRIVQTSVPQDLWRRPADDWTARFLGATTLIDAEVSGPKVRTPLGDFVRDEFDENAVDLADGPCRLALRPESLFAEAVADGPGLVTHSAALPSSWQLRVRTSIGEVDAVARERVEPGEQVRLGVDPDRIGVVGG